MNTSQSQYSTVKEIQYPKSGLKEMTNVVVVVVPRNPNGAPFLGTMTC